MTDKISELGRNTPAANGTSGQSENENRSAHQRDHSAEAFENERLLYIDQVASYRKITIDKLKQNANDNKALAAETSTRVDKDTKYYTGKIAFYDFLANPKLPFNSKFSRKMLKKKRKYQAKLDAVVPCDLDPLQPAPFKDFDEMALRMGTPRAIAPDASQVPDVSIVIPVYNQVDYTKACLRSLILHKTKYRFEVIVVDDCSTDETPEILSDLPWVRYVRQPENGGFIQSCNTGLSQSRGHFVLFLNNDTEVMPGWLDELVGSFEIFPNAGLVGSRLIYPDGSLQESGGILWQDGSGFNVGRNQDPHRPEFCYARKVDYCSGASIMLRRELLTELNGFDDHYAPAYCEDSDLAMRVREAGLDVMVQPLSQIVHYEGISSGKDVSSGVKSYQVVNSQKLFERWKNTLSSRPANTCDPEKAKDFGIEKRLLVIDENTPEPDKDAGSVTCTEIMRCAQDLGYQVTFIPRGQFSVIDGYTQDLQRMGIEVIYRPFSSSIEQHLQEHGERYDAVMVYRVNLLWDCYDLIRKYAPQARLVYQTSDLHHLREARQAEIANDPEIAERAERSRLRELELIGKCEASIVHSEFEQTYLAKEVPGAQVEVFNWVLDPKGTDVPFEARNGMMFLGGFNHSPNEDAVYYFLDEIWPLVEKRLPDAVFHVVGSSMPDDMKKRATDRVEMVGFVQDLRDVMDTCRMSIVPLRFGAGTKGKLAMSLAYGLPAVSTTIGAEGMGLTDGTAVFVADDPEAFADRIVALHEDAEKWQQMSDQSLEYVENNLSRNYGRDVIRKALAADVG